MFVPKVLPQHLGPASAFKADDIVWTNRLPDRDSRGAILLWLRSFPGCEQGLVHGVDERRYVGWRDLVLLDVAANDLGDQSLSYRSRRVIAHARSSHPLLLIYTPTRKALQYARRFFCSVFRIRRGGVDFYTLIALLIAVVIAALIIWIIVPKD